jgi:replicative DNA helicase
MPCSVEAEQALLGAIIIDSQRMNEIADKIDGEDFYLSVHTDVFNAINYLFKENQRIDAVTVLNELVTKGIFDETTGKNFIKNLADTVPSVSNISNYVRIVKEKSTLRKLIAASEETTEDADADSGNGEERLTA